MFGLRRPFPTSRQWYEGKIRTKKNLLKAYWQPFKTTGGPHFTKEGGLSRPHVELWPWPLSRFFIFIVLSLHAKLQSCIEWFTGSISANQNCIGEENSEKRIFFSLSQIFHYYFLESWRSKLHEVSNSSLEGSLFGKCVFETHELYVGFKVRDIWFLYVV